jgi:hypothetical protein
MLKENPNKQVTVSEHIMSQKEESEVTFREYILKVKVGDRRKINLCL